jgi:penicillin-binding protein 1A
LTAPSASPNWLNRRNVIRILIAAAVAVAIGAAAVVGYLFIVVAPNLPSLDAVTDYRPKIPLRIYTADKVLIGEFGEEHRDFVAIKDVPDMMKKSILAIEDTRFYEHGGIDWIRALGAARANLAGGFRQGASTITMQVARNFFLSRDKVIARKLTEVMLAYRIEAALSKDEILELYINQIYLGQRSFGFAGAARTYFGKSLKELSIAEVAMLAGLPKNPAHHNPISNPKRAKARQQVVLARLHEVGYITDAQYEQARHEPLHVNARGTQGFDTHAEYVAELARQVVFEQYKEESYTRGINVYTTILSADQDAAYESVRRNVIAYDQRHGYRGPEAYIDLPADAEEREDAIDEALAKRVSSDGLIPAMVLDASPSAVKVETVDGEQLTITGDGLKLAASALSDKAKPTFKLRPGAVVRVMRNEKKAWSISQVPKVAAAFAAIDADTGAYHAMVGGFDYTLQKFNHVTQAWRQPGSSFKPFVYSAALEKGYSPATLVLDEPIELPGASESEPWRPQNDDGVFDGPITMRRSLAASKNVPSVRILRATGVPFTHEHVARLGFEPGKHPSNFTMALGTGSVTTEQMASAYAVFANGGFKVKPYLISRITDSKGAILSETKPEAAAQDGNRVLNERNVFIMDSMLHEVTRSGTGAQATQRLGRSDIAGKTGTTSDAMDGWFAGYGGGIVAVAWMGYDEPKSLGGREFGATLSLPIWIDYMKVALAKRGPVDRQPPEGVVQHNGDWMFEEYANDPTVRGIDIDSLPAPEGEAPAEGENGAAAAPAAPLPQPVAPPPPPPAQ